MEPDVIPALIEQNERQTPDIEPISGRSSHRQPTVHPDTCCYRQIKISHQANVLIVGKFRMENVVNGCIQLANLTSGVCHDPSLAKNYLQPVHYWEEYVSHHNQKTVYKNTTAYMPNTCSFFNCNLGEKYILPFSFFYLGWKLHYLTLFSWLGLGTALNLEVAVPHSHIHFYAYWTDEN